MRMCDKYNTGHEIILWIKIGGNKMLKNADLINGTNSNNDILKKNLNMNKKTLF